MECIKKFASDRRADLHSANKLHLVYLLVIFYSSFAFGITVCMYGPSMEDIRKLYNVESSVMPLTIIVQSTGFVIGTTIGLLYRWLNRQLVMGSFLLLLSFSNTSIPLCTSNAVAFLILIVQGISIGVYASSFQIWIGQMFPARLNTLLCVNQFCYGMGTVVAPIIVGPYLFGNRNVDPDVRRSSVMKPFIIGGAIQATASAILFILYLTNRYYEPQDEPAIKSTSSGESITSLPQLESSCAPASTTTVSISWRKTKIALCTLFLALYYTSENGYLYYCSTMWMNLPIRLSPVEASYVQATISASYTTGPIVTAFVSLHIKPDLIISYHFAFLVTGLVMLYIGQSSMTLIYIGSAIIGYGMSAMVATIFAWGDVLFRLNNHIATLFSLANGTFFLTISSILIFFTIDQYPNVLFTITFGYVISSLTLFIGIRTWIAFSKPN